jgi:hypothetical protein
MVHWGAIIIVTAVDQSLYCCVSIIIPMILSIFGILRFNQKLSYSLSFSDNSLKKLHFAAK